MKRVFEECDAGCITLALFFIFLALFSYPLSLKFYSPMAQAFDAHYTRLDILSPVGVMMEHNCNNFIFKAFA
jgi:hypothetical protein